MRAQRLVLASALLLLSFPAVSLAQGAFGLGGRLAMVRPDAATNLSAERFLGGQLRARMSPRTAFELSLDRRREQSLDLTQRVTDYPIQASLLIFPVRSRLSPYVLAGFGWYTHKIEDLVDGDVTASTSVRKTGYHAGFGAEIALGRHAGVHADYRYTFLHFGDSADSPDTGPSSLASRLIPSYDGSMWTAGFTVYF
jgi:hypothetical protein